LKLVDLTNEERAVQYRVSRTSKFARRSFTPKLLSLSFCPLSKTALSRSSTTIPSPHIRSTSERSNRDELRKRRFSQEPRKARRARRALDDVAGGHLVPLTFGLFSTSTTSSDADRFGLVLILFADKCWQARKTEMRAIGTKGSEDCHRVDVEFMRTVGASGVRQHEVT
jgi:hypothetical protein